MQVWQLIRPTNNPQLTYQWDFSQTATGLEATTTFSDFGRYPTPRL